MTASVLNSLKISDIDQLVLYSTTNLVLGLVWSKKLDKFYIWILDINFISSSDMKTLILLMIYPAHHAPLNNQ